MTPEIYRSSKVVRYHANPEVINRFMQTNGDHQWGVAALILLLNKNPSMDLVRAAMFHDAPELLAGDMPWPVKVANPEHAKAQAELELVLGDRMGVGQPPLADDEKQWLHLADRLESFLCMQMFGGRDQWKPDLVTALVNQAEELGVEKQVKDLINGK